MVLPPVDVLVPTYDRPAALAVTLAGLVSQTHATLRVVVSDQTEPAPSFLAREVSAAARVLRASGREVELRWHLPRRGMAEQRQFLLDNSSASYVLFLDDDLLLEPYVLELMLEAIQREGCGFVGCAPIGLSHADDVRPDEQVVEFWEGPVQPKYVTPNGPEWWRHRLHNAANTWHLQQRLQITPATPRLYKVAWVGGCVLFDAAALREAGGFGFWRELPSDHCGEDVLAQLRVMAKRGGCGLLPSGVHHLELPTTLPSRQVNAPEVLIPW